MLVLESFQFHIYLELVHAELKDVRFDILQDP